ncbi:hypothetical protein PV325_007701 [Microctonus aethiopoides]|nr:hypothetical protein PV325_007701 [Microctonus aethiopoides]
MSLLFPTEKLNSDVEYISSVLDKLEKRWQYGRDIKFVGPQAQIQTSVVVGSGFTTAATNTKMPRGLLTRRGLQALALVLATAYATMLIYQAVVPRQWTDENVVGISGNNLEIDMPEIQRIIADEIAVTPPVATATVAPYSTDLNDVFISVKTTRNYHYSRLPSIISTWFQYAKDQMKLQLAHMPLQNYDLKRGILSVEFTWNDRHFDDSVGFTEVQMKV